MKKNILVLAVPLFMGLLLCLNACGGATAKGPVEISWATWGDPDKLGRFTDFTEQFNKRHEGKIVAKLTATPNDTYDQKLLTQLTADSAPDVFYIGDVTIAKYVSAKQLLDLAPYMKKSATVKPEMFTDNLYGAAKQGDSIYGIPPDCNPYLIIYNKDLIKAAGAESPEDLYESGKWNWNSFKDVADKAKKSGKEGFVLGNNAWHPILAWLGNSVPELFKNDTGRYSVNFADPSLLSGMNFLRGMIDSGDAVYGGTLPKGQGERPMFISGQVAMIMGSRSTVAKIRDQIKDFDWDVVPLPKSEQGTNNAPIAGSYVAINAKCAHPEAAFTFLEEYVNAEGQRSRLKSGGNALPSINDSSLNDLILSDAKPAHGKYFFDARNTGIVYPTALQKNPEANTVLLESFDLLMLKQIDVAAAAERLDKGMNSIFSR